jgi:steroid 5-alpha reductase family enzyme
MNQFDITVLQILALAFFVHAFFVFALIKKRNDIADVAWGLGFLLLALLGMLYNFNLKTLAIFLPVSIWSLRLSAYIWKRFKSKDREDPRYYKWRSGWGNKWIIYSYLKVFLLQGFLLVLVAAPIMIAARFSTGEWSFVNFLGLVVWAAGFIFEVIADKQLSAFVKNKKPGEIMTAGLWKYSRHPNYFGEAVLWWGVWLINFGTPYHYFGLIGPLAITFLLRFVSGVPMAEERYQNDPVFLEYKKKTPAFVPNFFKR